MTSKAVVISFNFDNHRVNQSSVIETNEGEYACYDPIEVCEKAAEAVRHEMSLINNSGNIAFAVVANQEAIDLHGEITRHSENDE